MKSLPGRGPLIWGMLIAAIAAGLWWGGRGPEQPPILSVASSAVSRAAMTVHVGGWVAYPGLVELAEGARVADAIAAAGGTLPGAAIAALNLAATLVDGEQVLVPGPESSDSSLGVAAEGGGPIHLNRATAAELDELPGIGPVIAQRIVDHRENNGPFETIEDLLDVPGIGEAKLASIRELVVP